MSGDPRQDSVILWTRIEDSLLAGSDAPVTLQLANDETFNNPIVSFDINASETDD